MIADPALPVLVERHTLTADDIDHLGHLTWWRYHELLGAARVSLLVRTFGPAGDSTFVLVRTELDHLGEVVLSDGFVDVRAAMSRLGTKSIVIHNDVLRADGTVAARGIATIVAWDGERRTSRPISDAERAACRTP